MMLIVAVVTRLHACSCPTHSLVPGPAVPRLGADLQMKAMCLKAEI